MKAIVLTCAVTLASCMTTSEVDQDIRVCWNAICYPLVANGDIYCNLPTCNGHCPDYPEDRYDTCYLWAITNGQVCESNWNTPYEQWCTKNCDYSTGLPRYGHSCESGDEQ